MINVSEAIGYITQETKRLGTESVAIAGSVGRLLAENVMADTDMPPFDRSQMDGFAVLAADTAAATIKLKVVGESAAGHGWHQEINPGEAVRIMTGAPVPMGANAVQKVELTNEIDGFVEILEPVDSGHHIVQRGTEIHRGEVVIGRGRGITRNMVASLAAFGYASVNVSKRPKVAILSTGSEIVEIDQTPGVDQIRNSNSIMLASLADGIGCDCHILPIINDDLSSLKNGISSILGKFDILIITGGVSVGKYDLTKLALHELGSKIFFEKVRLRPGKPAVFAKNAETLIFGLPGNPVSAAVTFYLFVRTAIMIMQGATDVGLREGHAVLAANVRAAKERDTYLPARLTTDMVGRLVAEPVKWLGSSDFVGFADAEALICLSRGDVAAAGTVAKIVFL